MTALIERLPWESQYKLALADDETLVPEDWDGHADDGDRGSSRRPPIREWNELKEMRAAILDGLASVERTVIAVNTPKGKRVPDLKPQPRPENAYDRVARTRRDRAMSELESALGFGMS